MVSALHSNNSQEWYTPSYIVETCRSLMGSIELDPASCVEANEVVKADRIFTKEEDGLRQIWLAKTVFLNPPSNTKTGDDRHLVLYFWSKLVAAWLSGNIEQAVYICYSLEQLQSIQANFSFCPNMFPMCAPSKRIRFIGAGKSPTHGNAIVWLPPVGATYADTEPLWPLGRVSWITNYQAIQRGE